jgi:N-glycosylase/DNA lyase
MGGVRFHNNKSGYIIEARDKFFKNRLPKDPKEAREWLVDNIKGLGYKEASHFLRNIGLGRNIAILDRHILKNLMKYNVINEIPKTLTPKRYLEIEDKMKQFSKKNNIPLDELDLLFWAEETGEVFK